MPRQKNPKKTNGVADTVVATGSATQKVDVAPEKTSTPLVQQASTGRINTDDNRATEMKVPTVTSVERKPGKPEIVKTESRSNLVPISLDSEIRKLAYLLSERRGFEPGHEAEDWLNAEREVLDRYHQHQQTA